MKKFVLSLGIVSTLLFATAFSAAADSNVNVNKQVSSFDTPITTNGSGDSLPLIN